MVSCDAKKLLDSQTVSQARLPCVRQLVEHWHRIQVSKAKSNGFLLATCGRGNFRKHCSPPSLLGEIAVWTEYSKVMVEYSAKSKYGRNSSSAPPIDADGLYNAASVWHTTTGSWIGNLSNSTSTSTRTADSTTSNCARQTSSSATTSNSTSIIFEYEQCASHQCAVPCANGCRSVVPRKAEPAMRRSGRDLNVLLTTSNVKRKSRNNSDQPSNFIIV